MSNPYPEYKRNTITVPLAEQPAQPQPVGYVAENGVVDWNVCAPPIMTDLFTSPPAQREPLTDDELTYLWYNQSTDWMEFARAIEAAHGIKENT